MDRLTFFLVAFAAVLLAALPLLRPDARPPQEHAPAEPSLEAALEEDLRTGKISRGEYDDARREERS